MLCWFSFYFEVNEGFIAVEAEETGVCVVLGFLFVEGEKVQVQKLGEEFFDSLEEDQNLGVFLGDLQIFEAGGLYFFGVGVGDFVGVAIKYSADNFAAVGVFF